MSLPPHVTPLSVDSRQARLVVGTTSAGWTSGVEDAVRWRALVASGPVEPERGRLEAAPAEATATAFVDVYATPTVVVPSSAIAGRAWCSLETPSVTGSERTPPHSPAVAIRTLTPPATHVTPTRLPMVDTSGASVVAPKRTVVPHEAPDDMLIRTFAVLDESATHVTATVDPDADTSGKPLRPDALDFDVVPIVIVFHVPPRLLLRA